MAIQQCSRCNSTFAKVEHLKRHERSHTGEKTYQCKHCQKRFARRDVLNRHVKGHGEKGGLRFITTGPIKPQVDSTNASLTLMSDCLSSPVVADSLGSYAVTVRLEEQLSSISVSESATSVTVAPSSVAAPAVTVSARPALVPSTMNKNLSSQPPVSMDSRGIASQAQIFSSSLRTRQSEDQMGDAFMHLSPGSSLFRENTPCVDASIDAFASPPQTVSCGDGFPSLESNRGLFSVPISHHDLRLSPAGQINNTSLSMTAGSPAWSAMFSLETPTSMDTMPCQYQPNLQPPSPITRDFQPFVGRATDRLLSSDISDERFAKMARVWPKKGERPWYLMQTLFLDAISYPGANLFREQEATKSHPSPATISSVKSRLELDHEKYISLVKEFAEEDNGINARFPSDDTLSVCIDLYFQRFHSIMGFIHQPTFAANNTPNIVLFSICLIGLAMLDPESNRAFVSVHLSRMMDRCETELSMTWRREESIRLCAVFAASVLLLCCAALISDHMSSEHTYAFYTNILFIATRHGLFEVKKSEQLPPVVPQQQNDDLSWKAWARCESANRMVACLVMADALFSSSAGTSPVIRTETMRLYAPCSNALFAAPDAKRWHEMIHNGPAMNAAILDFGIYPSDLPQVVSSNGLAMHTLLAAVMIRIGDIRQRGVAREHMLSNNEVLFPCIEYLGCAPGLTLMSFLLDIYAAYQQDLNTNNPNGLAFWHSLCILLTANMDLFELAAGRRGPQPARDAIGRISKWAQTPIARRACLHAAQIYACMSQRKITDGTMFMSEIAIFNSALVLGLYLYVSPLESQVPGTSPGSSECLELLDEVDWTSIGNLGLRGDTVSQGNSSGLAKKFIAQGCSISFAGTAYVGGYCSARRVILDYVGLLEEVGRWKVRELCQILRLMCGSMLEMN